MTHPALIELCRTAGYDGDPPEVLSSASVLAVLEWCGADIDELGRLWTYRPVTPAPIPLEYGGLLRQLIAIDA